MKSRISFTTIMSIIGLVAALAGLVLSVQANQQSRLANQLAQQANEQSQISNNLASEANEVAKAANTLAEQANAYSKAANELSQESNQLSREANSIALQEVSAQVKYTAQASRVNLGICTYPNMMAPAFLVVVASNTVILTNSGGKATSLLDAQLSGLKTVHLTPGIEQFSAQDYHMSGIEQLKVYEDNRLISLPLVLEPGVSRKLTFTRETSIVLWQYQYTEQEFFGIIDKVYLRLQKSPWLMQFADKSNLGVEMADFVDGIFIPGTKDEPDCNAKSFWNSIRKS